VILHVTVPYHLTLQDFAASLVELVKCTQLLFNTGKIMRDGIPTVKYKTEIYDYSLYMGNSGQVSRYGKNFRFL